LKIAVDAMGGDSAPSEPVKGALQAAKEYGIEIALVGAQAAIESELARHGGAPANLTVVPASDAISMDEEKVVQAVRQRPDSSINVAMSLVRDGSAAALVSAGHTGAILASAFFVLGRIRGIERPALGTLLPFNDGKVFLLDVGANPDCKPAYLVQFAQMGAAYMEQVVGIANPRVGLLNLGTEDNKGSELVQEAFPRLRDCGVNFVGNVEGVGVHKGVADVVVTDGFTGNIGLKVGEGIADYILEQVRYVIKSSPLFIAASLLLKPALKRALKRLQYDEYGGAQLLGVNGVVLIAHGRSDANAIKNAIRLAALASESNLLEAIATAASRNGRLARAAATS
jgi:glycerol-3-phosphate acyltransferase PlsX